MADDNGGGSNPAVVAIRNLSDHRCRCDLFLRRPIYRRWQSDQESRCKRQGASRA